MKKKLLFNHFKSLCLAIRRDYELATKINNGYWLFIVCYLSRLPCFTLEVEYDPFRAKMKKELRQKNLTVGHSLSWRVISLLFFNFNFLRKRFEEGESSTAFQFYLNRRLYFLVKFIRKYPIIANKLTSSVVFDPGCGCGKHLLFLRDNFGSEIFGVDPYIHAIEVAKRADFKNEGTFICSSAFSPEILTQKIPSKIDVLLMDSWLKHVKDYPELYDWFNSLLPTVKYALVNIGKKEEKQFEIIFKHYSIIAHLNAKESVWYFIDLAKKDN